MLMLVVALFLSFGSDGSSWNCPRLSPLSCNRLWGVDGQWGWVFGTSRIGRNPSILTIHNGDCLKSLRARSVDWDDAGTDLHPPPPLRSPQRNFAVEIRTTYRLWQTPDQAHYPTPTSTRCSNPGGFAGRAFPTGLPLSGIRLILWHTKRERPADYRSEGFFGVRIPCGHGWSGVSRWIRLISVLALLIWVHHPLAYSGSHMRWTLVYRRVASGRLSTTLDIARGVAKTPVVWLSSLGNHPGSFRSVCDIWRFSRMG